MNTYPTKDLIPGYLNDNTQSDKEFLEFHHWIYNIQYISCDINLSNRYKTTYFYKEYYDIDVSSKDILSKSYINVGKDVIKRRMRNREDVLTLINYDRRILERISSIYNISINSMMNNILQGDYIQFIITLDNLFIYHNYGFNTMFIEKYKEEVHIPDYIDEIYIIELRIPLINLPSHVVSVSIVVSSLNGFIDIPETVTRLEISEDVSIYSVSLHNNIKALKCYAVPNITLPSNLVHLWCGKLNPEVKLPKSLKELVTDDVIQLNILPKDIEYLQCSEIGQSFIDTESLSSNKYTFDKCRYLNVSMWNGMSSIFPNLEVLKFKYSVKDVNDIKNLTKLLALMCNAVTFDLPKSLIYLSEEDNLNEGEIDLPDSVRVLSKKVINQKYDNITTLYCDTIEQEYIPDNIVMLYTKTMDLNTNDDVIYNFIFEVEGTQDFLDGGLDNDDSDLDIRRYLERDESEDELEDMESDPDLEEE